MNFPTLGSIVTRDVVSLEIDATVEAAVEKMHASNRRRIVVRNHALYYIFTTQDMARLKLKGVPFSTTFRDLTLTQIPLLDKEQSVAAALNLLDNSSGYVCVSGKEGELYGLLTYSDIISSVDPQIMLDNLTLGSMFENRFDFITLESDYGMRDVLQEMDQADTDSVIVTEAGKPVGIVTSKDILSYFSNSKDEDLPLSHYMSTPLQMLPADCSIGHALKFLQRRSFKRIVVARADGSVAGIVSEDELLSRTFSRWSSRVKERFTEVEELAQALNEKNVVLTQMATKDALTGLTNRYLFEELFDKELARSRRYGRALSLVITDIDHFKSVNDTYGHNVGDNVLKELAALVEANIRKADTFARWGGEEFVLMLPDTTQEQAEIVAEKLRSRIETHAFEDISKATCSFGVVLVSPEDTLAGSIEKADRALYEAKAQGRNRVVCYWAKP